MSNQDFIILKLAFEKAFTKFFETATLADIKSVFSQTDEGTIS